MRAVVQRVKKASVAIEDEVVGEISHGLLVLLGVGRTDTAEDARYLAKKIAKLRIFPDQAGKMNLAVGEVEGDVLAVSQFTLYGDCRKGRRPSFSSAAAPDVAEELYLEFVAELLNQGLQVETGVFQAHMNVQLINDGPVTLIISSEGDF